jgi:hypothetical protein
MLLSCHWNAGQICDIKTANKSFENVSQFKYLEMTNQNLIQEEIERRFNSGNTCCHSVQNLLSSRLLSKSVKIRIRTTIILPVVQDGCEAWSLTLREEHGLRVFENRVLRRIFGQMGEKRNAYRLLVGKPEGKRPLGRPSHKWVANIMMNLGEIGWGDVDWIGVAQNRWVESPCECGNEPSGSIKCWETIKWLHE